MHSPTSLPDSSLTPPSTKANQAQNPANAAWIAVLVALVLAGLYLHFFAFRAHVSLEIETPNPQPDFVNLYWDNGDGGFSEGRKNRVRINSNHSKYQLFIGDLDTIRQLRLDPLTYPGELTIKSITISQVGYAPIVLDNETSLERLKPANQISASGVDKNGLSLVSDGHDPQLLLQLQPDPQYFLFPAQHILTLIGIFAFVWLFYATAGSIFQGLTFIPGCLLVILVLVTTMASITGKDVHPDETVHTRAANYYSDYWLPPPVESENIVHTFSVYGFSRLTSMEIYYPLAGYFARIFEPLKLSELLNIRLFGIGMIVFLLLFAIRRPDFRYFLLPFIASAQAWYLFSYANSDGFALFISLIMAYQVACRASTFNQFISDSYPPSFRGVSTQFWLQALALGLLAGTMLLIKTNYYFFVLFLGFFLIWRIFRGELPDQKRLWARLSLLVVIGLSLYGGRYALDVAANGFDNTRVEARMEMHAKPLFKPSTPLDKKHAYLYMKERGVTFAAIVDNLRWGEKTFITAFGAYGFTQFLASEIFYDLVRYTGLLILILIVLGAVIRGPTSAYWLVGAATLVVLALIVAAFWRSWTISFQPQGRYMMAIIPILAMVYYELRNYLPRRLITALTCGLFLLALYSFVFIGLHDVPKFDYVL